MQLGMIGLGRMGKNLAHRLLRGGHQPVVYDKLPQVTRATAVLGATGVGSLHDLCSRLTLPRIIWIMVPAGEPVDTTIEALRPLLSPGDILIDGGNSHYRDTTRRATELRRGGLDLVDSGTSGGILGLENGYCLMVGGSPEAVARCEPVFRALAAPNGYAHVGPAGAGHFVKMIHNGIEYGLLEAYAEGYELLQASKDFAIDLHQVAALWNHGSVIYSWMNQLAEQTLTEDVSLSGLAGWVDDSGEGRWTVEEAVELAVPAPVIALALFARFRSRQDDSFSARMIAALRSQVSGHPAKNR